MKSHLKIGLIYLLLITISCNQANKIPDEIYDSKTMESIMWDMMLADRHAWLTLQKDSLKPNTKLKTFEMYEDVFKIHKTNSTVFLRSYKFYLSRPDLAKVIFDSISSKANRNRSAMTGDFKQKK